MNTYLLISFLSMVVCLVMADVVYHKNKQSLSNRLFVIFSLLIAYWIFTQEFMCRQAADLKTALFWSKVGSLWLFSAPVFVHFIFVFTEKHKLLKNPLTYASLYLPALFFSFIKFTTELLGKLEKENWGYTIYNPPLDLRLFQIFILWALTLFVIAIVFLTKFYFQTTDQLKRKQIMAVFIGVSIGGGAGIIETLLVLRGIEVIAIESLEMSFLNLCMGYAIWKYQLFVIEPATAAENIIETMPDALLLADSEGIIVRINQSLVNLFQYRESEVVGNPIGILFSDKQFVESIQAELWKGSPVMNLETEMPTAQGNVVQVLISGIVVKDKRQKAVGAVYIIRDITERIRNEEILQSYAAKLKRTNQELQEFIYIASHDLQEPLRKIMVFGGRLQEKSLSLNEQERDYLTRMEKAAERMRMLITDLLMYSRVTLYRQPKPVLLGNVLQEVLKELAVMIEQSGGIIEIEALPTLEVDPSQIRQVFQNLISNALKYHRPGTPPQVKISASIIKEQQQDFVEICIADNGIGIEPADFQRIFGIFQRLHSREEYEGTGMGLAVCKKIVENHQGTIRVESMPGKGAKFLITLPLKQEDEYINR